MQRYDYDRKVMAERLTAALRKLIAERGFDPDCDRVLVPSWAIEKMVEAQFAEDVRLTGSNHALTWIYFVFIPEFRKYPNSTPYRGGIWTPKNSDAKQKMCIWSDGCKKLPNHSFSSILPNRTE